MLELHRAGLKTECQKALSVSYVEKMVKAHEIQLVNYLVATGVPVGLLINFGVVKVEVKRKVRQLTNCEEVDLQDENKLSCNLVFRPGVCEGLNIWNIFFGWLI